MEDQQNPPEPDFPAGLRGEIGTPVGKCADAILGSMEIIDTATGEVTAVVAPATSLRAPQFVNPPDPE